MITIYKRSFKEALNCPGEVKITGYRLLKYKKTSQITSEEQLFTDVNIKIGASTKISNTIESVWTKGNLRLSFNPSDSQDILDFLSSNSEVAIQCYYGNLEPAFVILGTWATYGSGGTLKMIWRSEISKWINNFDLEIPDPLVATPVNVCHEDRNFLTGPGNLVKGLVWKDKFESKQRTGSFRNPESPCFPGLTSLGEKVYGVGVRYMIKSFRVWPVGVNYENKEGSDYTATIDSRGGRIYIDGEIEYRGWSDKKLGVVIQRKESLRTFGFRQIDLKSIINIDGMGNLVAEKTINLQRNDGFLELPPYSGSSANDTNSRGGKIRFAIRSFNPETENIEWIESSNAIEVIQTGNTGSLVDPEEELEFAVIEKANHYQEPVGPSTNLDLYVIRESGVNIFSGTSGNQVRVQFWDGTDVWKDLPTSGRVWTVSSGVTLTYTVSVTMTDGKFKVTTGMSKSGSLPNWAPRSENNNPIARFRVTDGLKSYEFFLVTPAESSGSNLSITTLKVGSKTLTNLRSGTSHDVALSWNDITGPDHNVEVVTGNVYTIEGKSDKFTLSKEDLPTDYYKVNVRDFMTGPIGSLMLYLRPKDTQSGWRADIGSTVSAPISVNLSLLSLTASDIQITADPGKIVVTEISSFKINLVSPLPSRLKVTYSKIQDTFCKFRIPGLTKVKSDEWINPGKGKTVLDLDVSYIAWKVPTPIPQGFTDEIEVARISLEADVPDSPVTTFPVYLKRSTRTQSTYASFGDKPLTKVPNELHYHRMPVFLDKDASRFLDKKFNFQVKSDRTLTGAIGTWWNDDIVRFKLDGDHQGALPVPPSAFLPIIPEDAYYRNGTPISPQGEGDVDNDLAVVDLRDVATTDISGKKITIDLGYGGKFLGNSPKLINRDTWPARYLGSIYLGGCPTVGGLKIFSYQSETNSIELPIFQRPGEVTYIPKPKEVAYNLVKSPRTGEVFYQPTFFADQKGQGTITFLTNSYPTSFIESGKREIILSNVGIYSEGLQMTEIKKNNEYSSEDWFSYSFDTKEKNQSTIDGQKYNEIRINFAGFNLAKPNVVNGYSGFLYELSDTLIGPYGYLGRMSERNFVKGDSPSGKGIESYLDYQAETKSEFPGNFKETGRIIFQVLQWPNNDWRNKDGDRTRIKIHPNSRHWDFNTKSLRFTAYIIGQGLLDVTTNTVSDNVSSDLINWKHSVIDYNDYNYWGEDDNIGYELAAYGTGHEYAIVSQVFESEVNILGLNRGKATSGSATGVWTIPGGMKPVCTISMGCNVRQIKYGTSNDPETVQVSSGNLTFQGITVGLVYRLSGAGNYTLTTESSTKVQHSFVDGTNNVTLELGLVDLNTGSPIGISKFLDSYEVKVNDQSRRAWRSLSQSSPIDPSSPVTRIDVDLSTSTYSKYLLKVTPKGGYSDTGFSELEFEITRNIPDQIKIVSPDGTFALHSTGGLFTGSGNLLKLNVGKSYFDPGQGHTLVGYIRELGKTDWNPLGFTGGMAVLDLPGSSYGFDLHFSVPVNQSGKEKTWELVFYRNSDSDVIKSKVIQVRQGYSGVELSSSPGDPDLLGLSFKAHEYDISGKVFRDYLTGWTGLTINGQTWSSSSGINETLRQGYRLIVPNPGKTQIRKYYSAIQRGAKVRIDFTVGITYPTEATRSSDLIGKTGTFKLSHEFVT